MLTKVLVYGCILAVCVYLSSFVSIRIYKKTNKEIIKEYERLLKTADYVIERQQKKIDRQQKKINRQISLLNFYEREKFKHDVEILFPNKSRL